DLGLADAVDATEALLQAVRIPGQVVVDHKVSALQVDSLAGCVGGEEDLDFLVMRERLLGLAPILAADAAMNDDDCLGPSNECSYAFGKIVQGVAMLGEDDELAPMPVGVEHRRVVLQEPGQLIPLAIGSGLPYTQSDALQVLELGDFKPQLCDGAGGRRQIDDPFFGRLNLGIGGIVEIFKLIGRQWWQADVHIDLDLGAALEKLLFAKSL